jgi:hypothetical protein
MYYKSFFPTKILFGEENELCEKLLPLCDFYLEKTKTNLLGQNNFPSTLYDTLSEEVNNDLVVKETIEYICEKYIKKIIIDRGLNYKKENFQQPFGFFSSMGNGAQLRKHSHQDCQFSGIIYLEVGEDVPELIFYDPRPHPKFQTLDFYVRHYEVIKPKNGLIMIWDHWLEHEVDIKKNNEPRKCFSFNI